MNRSDVMEAVTSDEMAAMFTYSYRECVYQMLTHSVHKVTLFRFIKCNLNLRMY